MSDQNRIHVPGQPLAQPPQPCNIGMTVEAGCVQMTFEPPIVRMRLQPREARAMAIALLNYSDLAENQDGLTPPQPPEATPGS